MCINPLYEVVYILLHTAVERSRSPIPVVGRITITKVMWCMLCLWSNELSSLLLIKAGGYIDIFHSFYRDVQPHHSSQNLSSPFTYIPCQTCIAYCFLSPGPKDLSGKCYPGQKGFFKTTMATLPTDLPEALCVPV